MEVKDLISQLIKNKDLFHLSFSDIPESQFNWKPVESDIWSLKEILCHLYDEERLDFKPRISCIIEQNPPPPINPPEWVKSYASKDYNTTLASFIKEREHSIAFLNAFDSKHWNTTYQYPDNGPIRSCRFFLDNWLAHDLLHLRQITKLRYLYLDAHSDHPIEYAGNWVI